MRRIPVLLLMIFFCSSIVGQTAKVEQTTIPIEVPKQHSPKKAGWYSAALPGLGQAYNKKYWKIPIVWAGFGATGYFIYANAGPMSKAKAAYIWMSNGSEGEAPNDFVNDYDSPAKLLSVYNSYRSNVELFTVITVAWYALNIIDAVVDAHLTDFDVSDNLSMSVSPFIMPNLGISPDLSLTSGVTLTIKF
ncbi:DUF5683 domain-containing protein [Bacteroidales bacterium OttesenSCG-928-K03]|nr:DUF5683 domain-containing protein [Odoribacter sp. OttesenSCG-928-L07]MDL2242643.1 DUF5683 domain-containing protein [Bacteroidales bacterium OttesenSCG-928-K03]